MKQDLLKLNPCKWVEFNETKSRERVLSESEIQPFWKAFDDAGYIQSLALKMILLTGQRPGEVIHMRTEHIKDGWWELPESLLLNSIGRGLRTDRIIVFGSRLLRRQSSRS